MGRSASSPASTWCAPGRLGADSVELNTQREEYSAIATSGESSRVIIASAERWKPFGGEGADEDGDAEAGTYNTVDERV